MDRTIAETDFPKRLKQLRERRRVSRSVLAELCGLSKSVISKYERSERDPSLLSLIALADYFGCSIDFLVGRE